jgi:hypothetical protein
MLVEAAAEAGIPSVLVDLTNSIRHGDVCLLGGPDPYLIEVKTAGRLDQRGKRQVADIDRLHAFYETDVGAGLRGYPELRRVMPAAAERCYADEMNACMDRAERDGVCIVNPEAGLYYAAIYEAPAAEAMFGDMTLEIPLVFPLNDYKSSRSWSPYYPFTLSIDQKHHLYNFIQGELFLVVFLDVAVLCRHIATRGFEANFKKGDDYPLQFRDPMADGNSGISHHFLLRVGLEFLSPKRVVDQALQMWRSGLSAEAS